MKKYAPWIVGILVAVVAWNVYLRWKDSKINPATLPQA